MYLYHYYYCLEIKTAGEILDANKGHGRVLKNGPKSRKRNLCTTK